MMQERRAANRFRTNLTVRWESLKSQGRGELCDLSASGCFILTGGQLTAPDLVRVDLELANEVTTVWGYVIYGVPEIGFALRFAFANARDRPHFEALLEKINRS
jgi:hypothetical protein